MGSPISPSEAEGDTPQGAARRAAPKPSLASLPALLWREKELLLVMALAPLALAFEHAMLGASSPVRWALVGGLILAIVLASEEVADEAQELAKIWGEPYGTIVLTVSAVAVETLVLATLLSSSADPALARDAIFSALMLDINGILGIAAVVGGLRHGVQSYNVSSGHSYLSMIAVSVGIAFIMPTFVRSGSWQAFSIFTICVTAFLYAVFLRLQTVEHRSFFRVEPGAGLIARKKPRAAEKASPWPRCLRILLAIAAIGLLAECLGSVLGASLEGAGLPKALPALLIAFVSAAPELMTAVNAAKENRLQSTVNIALGASVSTILLTVPVIELLALFKGQDLLMAFSPAQTALCAITLLTTLVNGVDGRSNALEGVAHLALFATFLFLSLIGAF